MGLARSRSTFRDAAVAVGWFLYRSARPASAAADRIVKRLLLGSAFLLWGIVQLMPPSVIATDLGDLVIALYVLDLGIIIQAELREA